MFNILAASISQDDIRIAIDSRYRITLVCTRCSRRFERPDYYLQVGEGLGMNMPQPIERFRRSWRSRPRYPEQAPFVIERLLDREPVGGCSLFEINGAARTAVLGIWLGKPFWDEGLGTDAVRTLCRFGFRHMNLQRIELNVFETNPRALRAYEKVGFTLEGTRRRSEFV